MSQSPDEDSLSSDRENRDIGGSKRVVRSQSPDEDSLSSDLPVPAVYAKKRDSSQSPDEDSLSSDSFPTRKRGSDFSSAGLNPLTRIHCLPTDLQRQALKAVSRLNPLTRIHCLPTWCMM